MKNTKKLFLFLFLFSCEQADYTDNITFDIENDIDTETETEKKNKIDIDTEATELLPVSFNWADYGIITEPKDQGPLGSCWAFSIVGVIEAQYALKGNKLTRFSEQQLINCAVEEGFTWHNANTLSFYLENGPYTEECAPYSAKREECSILDNCEEIDFRISKWYSSNLKTETIKRHLFAKGPGSFAFSPDEEFGYFWHTAASGSAYTKTALNEKYTMHSVLLIGWDDNKKAWLLKNSWGSSGPENNGTFWFSYSGHVEDLNPYIAFVVVE
jgi:cathepsin L